MCDRALWLPQHMARHHEDAISEKAASHQTATLLVSCSQALKTLRYNKHYSRAIMKALIIESLVNLDNHNI